MGVSAYFDSFGAIQSTNHLLRFLNLNFCFPSHCDFDAHVVLVEYGREYSKY